MCFKCFYVRIFVLIVILQRYLYPHRILRKNSGRIRLYHDIYDWSKTYSSYTIHGMTFICVVFSLVPETFRVFFNTDEGSSLFLHRAWSFRPRRKMSSQT